MKVLFWLTLVLIVLSFLTCRKSDYSLQDEQFRVVSDNGYGTGTTTWLSENEYLLDGLVFVNDGQTLTIELGTVIRARTGQGENASALIVARGGKIIADGPAVNPIIFTCENDDLEGSVPVLAKGLWGGLIVLGNAPLNNQFNEAHIEGIPLSEPRGVFGGNNEEDDSGILKYVSIRHCGTDIGEGNEINGLTLGGVGNKTKIEYLEVVSANDDGLEFFGGTVTAKYITIAFCSDDAIDYDLGYRGMGQFFLIIQDPANGDLCIEGGGGEDPETGQPFSIPYFSNITGFGRGAQITNQTIQLSKNAGGSIQNSIFVNQNKGVYIEYKENPDNSYTRFTNGQLKLESNLFYNISDNDETAIFNVYAIAGVDVSQQNSEFKSYFLSAGNFVDDPGLLQEDLVFFVIPQNNIHHDLQPLPDDWFTNVSYRGAFGSYNWAENWTLVSSEGIIQ
ncbi:MAG: hypothetical protein K8R53_09490 [Bacteroidales bacterium]|nr:hypothetical protein [Bacteroidales bacterium]